MPSPVNADTGTDPGWRRANRARSEPAHLVDLVQDQHLGDVARADLGQHPPDGVDLLVQVRRGGIGDVDDQLRQRDLLQRGPESFDEVVRQLPHEPHRVADRASPAAGELQPSHGGIEGREQLVGHEHLAPR